MGLETTPSKFQLMQRYQIVHLRYFSADIDALVTAINANTQVQAANITATNNGGNVHWSQEYLSCNN